jgi:hypothetical protein
MWGILAMCVAPFALGAIVLWLLERLPSRSHAGDTTDEDTLRDQGLRTRFGKPVTWISMGGDRTKAQRSSEFVVWYDPDAFIYIVEVYGPSNEVLGSRTVECSAEPRFGIDVVDYGRLFGESGEVSKLIAEVEGR